MSLILAVDLPRVLSNPLLPPSIRDLLTLMEREIRDSQEQAVSLEKMCDSFEQQLDAVERERDRLRLDLDAARGARPDLIKPEPKTDPKTGYPPGW